MAPRKKIWYARRPMGYNGQQYARGQVLNGGLAGAKNDEKLIALGYIAEYQGTVFEYQDNPDLAFISESTRNGYGQTQDRIAALRRSGMSDEDIDDQITEQAINQANRVAPVLEPAS